MTGTYGELADRLLEDVMVDVIAADEQMAQNAFAFIAHALGASLTKEQLLGKDWPAMRERIQDQLLILLEAGLPEPSAVRLAVGAVDRWVERGTDFPRLRENSALTREAIQLTLDDDDELASFAARLPEQRSLQEVREHLERMLAEGTLAPEIDADHAATAWRNREVWETARSRHLPEEVFERWAVLNLDQ